MNDQTNILVDSVVRDVRYAFRSFLRAPLVALTIVATVGLGLGLVTVVFTILNAYIFLADDVRNPHELFAVERQQSTIAEPELFTRAQYEALVRETDVFSDTFARGPDIDRWIDGQRMEGSLVTGNFFHVLGVSAERGRTLTPSDDLAARRAIVLSHRAWSRYFGTDAGVLGRTVLMNQVPFEVIGVMPDDFRGLEVAPPDFWVPLSLLSQFRPSTALEAVGIVGRLKPGVSRGQALEKLTAWDVRRREVDSSAKRPAANLVLEPKQGTMPLSSDVMLTFMPIFFAFGLILVIGCANVANLLLARAVARQREIGIRLAVGASRRRIIRQLLTESLLLALVSAALALGISRLALEAIVYTMMSTWPADIGDIRLAVPPADWRVALFLVAGSVVSTIFFALAPAFQATRLELVRAIRGEVARDSRPSRARQSLVALQVTASVLLLICSAVFLRSSMAAATVDPGIRTDDVLTLQVLNEQMRGTVLDMVRSEPLVVSFGAAWVGGLAGRTAYAEGANGKSPVTYQRVSPEYFGILDIDLVRGRGFAQNERSTSTSVAVVSESVARQLWPGLDAVGQVLRLEPDEKGDARSPLGPPPAPDSDALLARTSVVVGVARDVEGFRFGSIRMGGPGVYLPIGADAARTSLLMRVRSDPERARRALAERLESIDPNMAEVDTLSGLAIMETFLLKIPFWVTLILGALALLLTLSGLFSVLSYLVEQRTKEIGVRMAIGATRGNICALVLSQSARPVGIGMLLGGSLTAALGATLLATPAAEFIGESVRLFDPVAYVVSLLCIITACVCAGLAPALRASRINPVAALRRD